jgi:hypothetical protein
VISIARSLTVKSSRCIMSNMARKRRDVESEVHAPPSAPGQRAAEQFHARIASNNAVTLSRREQVSSNLRAYSKTCNVLLDRRDSHVTQSEEFLDCRFVTSRQQMRVALHQIEGRSSAIISEPQRILVQSVVPAGPGVPAGVRRKFRIEPGAPHTSPEAKMDLSAAAAHCIGLPVVVPEHRPVAVRQISQRRNDPRRHLGDAAFLGFCPVGPEDHPAARQTERAVVPAQIDCLP